MGNPFSRNMIKTASAALSLHSGFSQIAGPVIRAASALLFAMNVHSNPQ
jgi:hypothetical protein